MDQMKKWDKFFDIMMARYVVVEEVGQKHSGDCVDGVWW
jgi:hypothetical protein